MKKTISLVLTLGLLSACSQSINSNQFPQNFAHLNQNIMISSASDKQAENTINEHKPELGTIIESLYAENFADDLKLSGNATNNVVLNRRAAEKGGLLFNILNKSRLAQFAGYLIADYPVRAKFNKPSPQDNLAPINNNQLQELLGLLKPGDIILCGNNGSFVHAILHLGNGLIIHSLASKVKGPQKFLGVVKENLSTYVKRNHRDRFVVLRYKNLSEADFNKAASYADKQVGKSYDTLFLVNSDSRFYCTELVYQSLMQMNQPPRVYPHAAKYGWKIVTNEDFMDSPDFETIWELNRQRNKPGQNHQYR